MLTKAIRILVLSSIILMGKAYAQEEGPRGYIGITVGPSFLLGESNEYFEPGVGLNLTLVNFGYSLGKGFGITAILGAGAHQHHGPADFGAYGMADWELGYGMLMVGPQYTFHLSDKSSVDLNARVGSFYGRENVKMAGGSMSFLTERHSLGYSFGVGYRLAVASRWCVLISCDYASGNAEGFLSYEKRMTTVYTDAGVAFQF